MCSPNPWRFSSLLSPSMSSPNIEQKTLAHARMKEKPKAPAKALPPLGPLFPTREVFHQPHASSTLSLCSCMCLACPLAFTTFVIEAQHISWHSCWKLAPTLHLESTWPWRQGEARSTVPGAGHSFFLGMSPRSSPHLCQPVAWQGWNWDKGCWGRAEVAQLGEH